MTDINQQTPNNHQEEKYHNDEDSYHIEEDRSDLSDEEYEDETKQPDKTQISIQDALANASRNRDTRAASNQKNRSHKKSKEGRSSRSSKTTKAKPQEKVVEKYYYNPANQMQAPDNMSSVTAIATPSGTYIVPNNGKQQMQFIPVQPGANSKADDSDEDSMKSKYDFKSLDYEILQENLNLLDALKKDDKMHISSDGRTMSVYKGYLPSIGRLLSGDSRFKTLEFIKHLYAEAKRLCLEVVEEVNRGIDIQENTEKLMNLHTLIGGSLKGLDRLNMTYSNDERCGAIITTIKKTVNTFCDQTLKKTIEGLKSQDL